MSDPYKGITDSIKGVSHAISTLAKDTSAASVKGDGRMPVNVDTLTNREIEELRELIAHEGELEDFSYSRISSSGTVAGMYQEFSTLGLVDLSMSGCAINIRPMAHWAVEKHDQRKRERLEAEKDRRRFEKRTSYISAIIGVGGAVIGFVLGLVAKFL